MEIISGDGARGSQSFAGPHDRYVLSIRQSGRLPHLFLFWWGILFGGWCVLLQEGIGFEVDLLDRL